MANAKLGMSLHLLLVHDPDSIFVFTNCAMLGILSPHLKCA